MSDLREVLTTSEKVVGLRQVKREIARVKRVVLADDADFVLKEEVRTLCSERAIDVTIAPSKRELGDLCGIDVSCAVVGLTA